MLGQRREGETDALDPRRRVRTHKSCTRANALIFACAQASADSRHTPTRSRPRPRLRPRPRPRAHPNALERTPARSRTRTRTHAIVHARTHAHTHSHSDTRTHARTHARTRERERTHVQLLRPPPPGGLVLKLFPKHPPAHRRTLGAPHSSGARDIKRAFRQIARMTHPDVSSTVDAQVRRSGSGPRGRVRAFSFSSSLRPSSD
eukprot:2074966-Pleurochrysis_carterae.AAC.2